MGLQRVRRDWATFTLSTNVWVTFGIASRRVVLRIRHWWIFNMTGMGKGEFFRYRMCIHYMLFLFLWHFLKRINKMWSNFSYQLDTEKYLFDCNTMPRLHTPGPGIWVIHKTPHLMVTDKMTETKHGHIMHPESYRDPISDSSASKSIPHQDAIAQHAW